MEKHVLSDSEDDDKKRDGKKEKKEKKTGSKLVQSLSRISGSIFKAQAEHHPEVPKLALSATSSADDMPKQEDFQNLRKSVEHISYNTEFVDAYDAFFKAMILYLNDCIELLDLLDPISSDKQYRLADFVEQLKPSSADKYLGSSFAVKEFGLLIEKVKQQKLFISSQDRIEASRLLGLLQTIISRYADTDISHQKTNLPNTTFTGISALDLNVYSFLQTEIRPKDSGSRHYDDLVPNPTVQEVLSEDDVGLLMKCNAYCLPGINADVIRKSSEVFRAGFLSEIEKRSPALKLIKSNPSDIDLKFSDIEEFNYYFLMEIIPIVQQLFQRSVDVGEISYLVTEAVKKRFADHSVAADKRGVDKIVKRNLDALIEKVKKYFSTHQAKYAHLSELSNSKRTSDEQNAEAKDLLSQKFRSLKETLMSPMLMNEIDVWKKTISLIQSRVPNHLKEHANRLLVIHDALNELLKIVEVARCLFKKLRAHVQDHMEFLIQLNEAANFDLDVSLLATSDNQDVDVVIRDAQTHAVLFKDANVYSFRIPSSTAELKLYCEMNSSIVKTQSAHTLVVSVQNTQAITTSSVKKSQGQQTKRVELNQQYKSVQFHVPSASSFNVLRFGSAGTHFGNISVSIHGQSELSADKAKDYVASLQPNLYFTYLQLMTVLGISHEIVPKSPRVYRNPSGGLAQLGGASPRRKNSITDIREGSASPGDSKESPRAELRASIDPSTGRPKSGMMFAKTPGLANDGRNRAGSSPRNKGGSPRTGDRLERKSDRPGNRAGSIDIDSPGRLDSPTRGGDYSSGQETPTPGSMKISRRGFGKLDQAPLSSPGAIKRDTRINAPTGRHLKADQQDAHTTEEDTDGAKIEL